MKSILNITIVNNINTRMSELPWIEKYRPLKLDDIVSHTNIITLFKSTLETGNLPHLLMYGNPGSGKCLHGDTDILMYNGQIKKAYDIKINDQLMGDDYKPRIVLNLTSGIDDMYQIILSNGEKFIVNSKHILCLKTSSNSIYDICISDIINKCDMYWSYKIGPIESWNNTPQYNINHYVTLNNNNEDISELKYVNIEFRRNFINKIMHIDNTILVNNNIDIIKFILNSIGYHYCQHYDNSNEIYIEKNTKLISFNIKYIGKDKYYGFTITGNGRFVLGNFIVTHNTSTILALARELFGPIKFPERIIELNASDERGINIVRDKLVNYAKMAVGMPDPLYKCPPYKIIILDEADAMTTEAQSALRKIIEDKSNVTIFCFICNYIKQIIDPIASRCVKLHFKPIEKNYIRDKLVQIANKESMYITDDSIDILSDIAAGDMRKGIMLLQNLKYLNKNIEIEDVLYLANIMPYKNIENIVYDCLNAQSINQIVKNAKNIVLSGYPVDNILRQITSIILRSDILSDMQKINICLIIASKERLLIDGADEYLQILDILISLN